MNRKPNFDNLLKILNKQKPERPTLFEFFLNDKLYDYLVPEIKSIDTISYYKKVMIAYQRAGYDYFTIHGSDFHFPKNNQHVESTISLNEGFVITDYESFEKYEWPEPEDFDYSILIALGKELPEGMKMIAYGPSGILENTIALVGYDNLCYMLFEEPELAESIFKNIGERLIKYYRICMEFDGVGAIIANDDWGFNTQTMISPSHLRKYVFPYYKKIIEIAHQKGLPVILHSCGNLKEVMDDIIYDMKFDAKHSYEDKIMPVEQAYDTYFPKISILGGIDVDFVCRSSKEEITKRCINMIEKTLDKGGYALGTGNSVPYYVPVENYFAMIDVINHF